MSVGLLGRKIGMTQIYGAGDAIIPVTVVEAGPCTVLQLRTKERDGYEAVQIGFDDKLSEKDKQRPPERRNRSRATRPERGHVVALSSKRQKLRQAQGIQPLPKANCEPQRFIREFRTDGQPHELQVGQVITAGAFAGVTHVDVVGTSKGRGTAGVMKRHNFQGQPASHGAKKVHRRAGGCGAHSTNRGFSGGVKKGKRMAGQYGNAQATVRNLEVVRVDADNNMLLVRGAIPGPNGGYVLIRETNKVD